jgi:hypothetical protein
MPAASTNRRASGRAIAPNTGAELTTDRSSSTQRTYRYVRVSLVGVMLLLGAGLAQYLLSGGQLESISASFYTPVRNVFVGSMVAIGVALVSLSGHSSGQVMLNLAGMLAPVIGFVPKPIAPGSIPGSPEFSCGAADVCIPPGVEPDVVNGVTALLVVGAAGWIFAVVLAFSAPQLPDMRVRVGIAAAGALLLGGAIWFFFFRPSFLTAAHYVAAALFFVLIAAVAWASSRDVPRTRPHQRFYSVAYAVLAVAIFVGVLLTAIEFLPFLQIEGSPWVFFGEALVLISFAVYWILQTVEKWDETNPSFA